MKKILFVLLAITLIACKKESEDSCIVDGYGNNTESWVLTHEYFDPGDGSGDFLPATATKSIFWPASNAFVSSGSMCVMGDLETEETEVSSEGMFDIEAQEIVVEDCNDGTEFRLPYELNENELLVYYPCIEGCILKFTRIIAL